MLLIAAVLAGPREVGLERLKSHTTWCDGASRLAKLGDPTAIVPILAEFETNLEVPRGCLLDAMESLAANDGAERLWASADPAQKRAALRTMHLLADPRYVPLLAAATQDPAWEGVALAALLGQVRDGAWEEAMIGLLAAASPTVRLAAVDALRGRSNAAIAPAFTARLAVETNPAVRMALARTP